MCKMNGCSKKNVVFLAFSGGMDSTTLWSQLNVLFDDPIIKPVFFFYGSTHNEWELESALKISSEHFKTELDVVSLAQCGIFNSESSALLQGSTKQISDKAYQSDGSLASTVVPGRNLVIASILAAKAEAYSLQNKRNRVVHIALAVHGGDHNLYPDCRMDFLTNLKQTIIESTENRVHLIAPFANMTKADIVGIGKKLDTPFHLTRSCYRSQKEACGTCGTCQERVAAFTANDLTDPISYQ